jgi:hypothetical protein
VDNDSAPAARLPFSETFDGAGMATNLTVLNGQHSWTAGTNAVVQSGEFHGGAKALQIQNDTADHQLVFGSNRVAFSWWAKPAAGGAPAAGLLSGAAVVVWVGTSGNVMAYSNTTAVTLPVQVSSTVWNKFEVEADYGSNVWKLSVNGTNAAENLAFYSARSSNEAIRLIGGSRQLCR